jgi:beta-lactamase superfamily II metal-dependent hydrolase
MNSVEIDFLAVKSGEKSGDAIAIRYGNFSNRAWYKVVVIDGGTLESGKKLVEHIKLYYGTDIVDLVICTHPDADHASGLREVLKGCTVNELWIHKPWEHSEHVCDLFHDGRITDNSLSERLKDAYNYAHELVEIAEEKGIDVREPFAGRKSDDNVLTVLGPSIDYYRELIPEFTKSPKAKEGLLEKAINVWDRAVTWVQETLHIETLDESGVTSAENRSSAVVLMQLDGNKFLFTGDAGIPSLKNVIDYCADQGIDISNIRFMQVPHHGSKRNISPSILDAIRCQTAYISASSDSPKHPAKKVVNAYIRRGAKVYSTTDTICHMVNSNRGWGAAESHSFYNEVEE